MPDDTNKSKSEQPEDDAAERDLSGNEHQIEGEIEGEPRRHDAKNVPWWIDSKVQTKQVGAKHGYTDRE